VLTTKRLSKEEMCLINVRENRKSDQEWTIQRHWQKIISTLLSDILTILGIIGRAKYFWIVFTIKLKRNNLRHKLKKYMLKRALISL
jgi:hypothetical protein